MNAQPNAVQPSAAIRPPAGLGWAFLKKTAIMTLITVFLIGLFSTVYADPAWGARYTVFGLWAIVYFALTAFLLKSMVVDRNRKRGFALLAGKLAFLASMYLILTAWPIDTEAGNAEQFALLAGVLTPFAVLILRTLGFMMEMNKRPQPVPVKPTGEVEANR